MQNIAPWSICDGDPIIDPNGNSCVTRGGWQATGATRFSYDSAGNRRNNGGSYLTANRITAFAGCSYVTDNDGNVTSRTCGTQTVTFTWSAGPALPATRWAARRSRSSTTQRDGWCART